MESVVYTPNDVAKLLQTRISTVYDLIERGELPAIRIGRNYKIPIERFDAWMEETLVIQSEERKKKHEQSNQDKDESTC